MRCRTLAVFVLISAVIVGWLSIDRWNRNADRLDEQVSQMRSAWNEQDADLDRQRRVAEVVTIIECRRHTDACRQPATFGRKNSGPECTRRETINGVSRNLSCGTR